MSTREQQSILSLKELAPGLLLGGSYTLGEQVGSDGAGALFTVFAGSGARLLAKLMPEQGPETDQQLAVWRRMRHLQHVGLLQVQDAGRAELAGSNYIFGVFERPDEVLSSALQHGPLSDSEAQGVLDSALAAVRYLHKQGLVHGALDPDHVVAVGDTIKLTPYAVRESTWRDEQEDLRQLNTLVRSIRGPEPLSEPLVTLLRQTAAEGEEANGVVAGDQEIGELEELPVRTTAAPVITERVPLIHGGETRPSRRRGFPKWILVGVAALLFAILLFNLRRAPKSGPTPVAPVRTETTAPPPVAAPVAQPPSRSEADRAVVARRSDPAVWRVVAFTYRSREAAAKKVKQINGRWPDLEAGVFAPKGVRGYYLVTLGKWLSRDDAAKLQRKARRLGLPRDTFVQNYNE